MSDPLTLALLALIPFALAGLVVLIRRSGWRQRQREVRRELDENWPR